MTPRALERPIEQQPPRHGGGRRRLPALPDELWRANLELVTRALNDA